MGKLVWIPWDGKVKSKIVRGPHNMSKRILHWPYCARCGLVALKNEATRKALRKECVTEEDA